MKRQIFNTLPKRGNSPRRPAKQQQQGFALVVTLILMVLLSILALGMLSLSSISLRSLGQNNAQATARANARMGLLIALGNLQSWAGPDQRITGRADILDKVSANPKLTGVWKSWDISASSPPRASEYEKSARDQQFLGWLASSTPDKPQTDITFANSSLTNPVILWDEGSLGKTPDATDIVRASKVSIRESPGAYAYVVLDEGVKARINTPFGKTISSNALKTAELGTGRLPKASAIDGLGGLKKALYEEGSADFLPISKSISRSNLSLAGESVAPGLSAALKTRLHDVTPFSQGIFTNTAKGGLKKDLHLLTSSALPTAYANQGIYKTELGLNIVSDPTWESIRQFASLYSDTSRLTSAGGLPVLKAGGPVVWRASTGSVEGTSAGKINPTPPQGVVLMPTVAKVQLIFSILTRDIYNYPKVSDTTPKPPQNEAQERSSEMHNPWGGNFAGSSYDYLLHLLYTPIVTLHNPYNVPIEFKDLKVMFGNVPFALQVIRNGIPQTTSPAPLDTMYEGNSETGNQDKRFGLTIYTAGTNQEPRLPTFRLLPGEVVLFSPYMPPNRSFSQEHSGNRSFTDWDTGSSGTGRTLSLRGMPGWRGDGIGFDLDWFAPTYEGLRVSTTEQENGRSYIRKGCIGAKATDQWSLKFTPTNVPALSKNKFTVEIFATPVGFNRPVPSGLIEMDYESPTGLQTALTQNSSLLKDGSLIFPKDGGTINTMEMHSHGSTQIKDIYTARPFAVVSVQAKATNGGLNADGEDGRLATKPWAFGHASGGVTSVKVVQEGMASASHDISFQVLKTQNAMDNFLQYESGTGRTNFITGMTNSTGVKFGIQQDIPLGPIQSLSGLNGANPGGSSAYLPRFASPIGNSWAHPLLQPSLLVTPGPAYNYVDHSFLLNLALSDGYYFSGLAPRTGEFGSGTSTASLTQQFAAGTSLADPRLSLHTPSGQKTQDFPAVVSDADGYRKVAAWQMMNGAFNINSTSVAAWKAMLGSIHDPDSIFIDAAAGGSNFSKLSAVPDTSSRISRFRLPSAKGGGAPKLSYWLAAREYSDDELEQLAKKIVEQVRLRGPFLSMSEFINRRLGSENNILAQKGALQQAIDETNLNQKIATEAGAGYEIKEAQVASYKYANKTAGTGPSYQGAPGYLTQADLLSVLGNAATPRSDTFTIRAYGEAKDKAGKVTATAYCEAIVQRIPEYVDSTDLPDASPTSLTPVNQRFGRRFNIVQFRWLNSNEI